MKTAHTAMGGFRSKYVHEDKEVKTNDIYIISEKSVPRKDTPIAVIPQGKINDHPPTPLL
jgi:hypothetical protein